MGLNLIVGIRGFCVQNVGGIGSASSVQDKQKEGKQLEMKNGWGPQSWELDNSRENRGGLSAPGWTRWFELEAFGANKVERKGR